MEILSQIKHFFKTFTFKVAALLLAVLISITLPILLTLLFPVYIYRICIQVSAKFLKPELGDIVPTQSALHVPLGIYNKNPALNIVISFVIDGTPEKRAWRDIIKSLIEMRDTNGKIKYPELCQYFDSWMGYPFWKSDENFSIDNHLTFMNVGKFTRQDVIKFKQEAGAKPFNAKRSPWEFIVIPGLQENGTKTVFIFRCHHALSDGFGLVKLLLTSTEGIDGKSELNKLTATHTRRKKYSFRKTASGLLKILCWPYIIAEVILESFIYNPWRVEKTAYTNEFHCLTSSKLSTSDVKEIKNEYKVAFMSVILAAITSAVRAAFEIENKTIPSKLNFLLPFPIPGHKDKLYNHSTLGRVVLPTGETNYKQRLLACNKTLMEAATTLYPEMAFYIFKIVGGLPTCFIRRHRTLAWGGNALAYVPGPQQYVCKCGVDLLDPSYVINVQHGHAGVLFTVLTYNGGYRFTAMFDKSIFPNKEKLQKIIDVAVQEIETLKLSLKRKSD